MHPVTAIDGTEIALRCAIGVFNYESKVNERDLIQLEKYNEGL